MGSEISVTIVVISFLLAALVIFFVGRKYAKSGEKVVESLKSTNNRVTVLESVVATQAADPKIGELQASKLPLSTYRVSGSSKSTPPPLPQSTQVHNDPTPALLAIAAMSDNSSTYESSSSSYCGSSSSGSSDSGSSSSDSSSSCSSGGSDSY